MLANLQRACEAAIDAAMHLVRVKNLGVPQESREAFTMLCQAGIIEEELSIRLKAMVGFRNIAVHDYRALNLVVVRNIVETRLGDFRTYAAVILKAND